MVAKPARAVAARLLYGFLFVVILPLSLCLWASSLDGSTDLTVPGCEPAAIGIAVSGGLLVAKGMLDILVLGKGLPMNAFPPKNFVTQGTYAWFSHTIYLGIALLTIGLSLWFRSGYQ